MRFRPSLWPTVFTIPAVLVMLGLGTWQLDRLQWKTDLIEEITSRQTAAPVPLPALLFEADGTLGSIRYRRVRLAGTFLHDAEMYLAARSMNGNPGYHVMTPFRLAEGGVVLVDRGWVPQERKAPSDRPEGQVAGEVTLEGVVRVPRPEKSWLQPDNQPEDNIWFWVDLPAMAAHAGVAGEAVPVYVEAAAAEIPGGFPIGGQTRVNLPNDHLQYALTWYALAVILAVIYVIYHRQPKTPQDRPAG